MQSIGTQLQNFSDQRRAQAAIFPVKWELSHNMGSLAHSWGIDAIQSLQNGIWEPHDQVLHQPKMIHWLACTRTAHDWASPVQVCFQRASLLLKYLQFTLVLVPQ
jgi:hypothetical protein